MAYNTFSQFLTEAELAKTLKRFTDRSFGIITGGDVDNDKLLTGAAIKAKYAILHVVGEFVKPAEEKDENPTRTPDTSLAIIGGEKTSPVELRKFLFTQADRFHRPSFLFKSAKIPKMFVVGVDEELWPGRHVAAKLGEYAPYNFIALVKRWKGATYEFLALTE